LHSIPSQSDHEDTQWEKDDPTSHRRFLENKVLLGIIQQAEFQYNNHPHGRQRHEEMATKNSVEMKQFILQHFPMEEAHYYMKVSIATYGDKAILHSSSDQTPQPDAREQDFDGNWTLTNVVSDYTGIPKGDFLEWSNSDHAQPQNGPSYFLALHHQRRKIVLAIRGGGGGAFREVHGFRLQGFLKGQAPASMAIVAERLWRKVAPTIVQSFRRYPNYELIVTGHSMGGGCACLINLLMHEDQRMRKRKWRVFAFGSPPVFAPVSLVSEQAQTCINYIHQYDCVPFLSRDSIRHQRAMIAGIEEEQLDLIQRGRLFMGMDPVDPKLVRKVHDKQPQLARSQVLAIPARGNVWMARDERARTEIYRAAIADSIKMSEAGIFVHQDEIADHLPTRYERALRRVVS
jgi:Lipase (class 3)